MPGPNDPRIIDTHDVRAFCARAREAIDQLEASALSAAGAGWVVERRDHVVLATAAQRRAEGSLSGLLASLSLTLDHEEARAEREAAALIGDP